MEQETKEDTANDKSNPDNSSDQQSSAKATGASLLFRPSQLTSTVEKIWKATTPAQSNGKKMAFEQTRCQSKSSQTTPKETEAKIVPNFIFGQQVQERVKADLQEGQTETSALPQFSDVAADSVEKSEEKRDSVDDWSTLANESEAKVVLDNDYEIFTGEEDEDNILQIKCRLYVFDGRKKIWIEKGHCTLRINQKNVDGESQTRIVIRLAGVPRLVVNSKVWDGMIFKMISEKRLQLTATSAEPPQEIITCLITGKACDLNRVHSVLKGVTNSLKNPDKPTSETSEDNEEVPKKKKK